MLTNNLGPKFRKIRKDKSITLEQAAKEITTISRLSRWEIGQTKEGIPIEIYFKLLKRLNITHEELVDPDGLELKSFIHNLRELYIVNDYSGIQKLVKKLASSVNKDDDSLKFKILMAINFYKDLTEKNLEVDFDTRILYQRLSKISKWSEYDVILFANTQLLMNSSQVYELSRSLVSSEYDKGRFTTYTFATILNAIFVLLKQKSIVFAEKLLQIFDFWDLPEYDYHTLYRLKFVKGVYCYIAENDTDLLNELFSELKSSPMYKQLLSDFEFAFEQIKQIYGMV